MTESDMSRLPHYMSCPIQPIEVMKAIFTHEQFIGYLRGNVIKYVMRYPQKGGREDLLKAQVYLDWLVKETSKENRQ